MKTCFCSLLFLLASQLSAQTHNDCSTALRICDKQTLHIDSVVGAGLDKTELNEATCFLNGAPGNVENNSYWIRLTAAAAGSLFFTITPTVVGDDVDFAFFHLPDSNNCQQKQIMRCMAAGDVIADSPCMGPTGLMPGETDTTGMAGCADPNANNFLAPVELQAGETYLLCVQNFSAYRGFQIEFCGSALLGCETQGCASFITATQSVAASNPLQRIYPNPVSTDHITLDLELAAPQHLTLTLVNALGPTLRTRQIALPEGRHTLDFPVQDLPAGTYWLRVNDGQRSFTQPVGIVR